MKYIKACLFFLGALLGMALMGFFGVIGFIGIYEIVTYLAKHCPNILIGSGLFIIGVSYVSIGWGIFCKCADKLKHI